ncbi:methyltransferase domain-containing protein [Thermodesulfobacteriota bacterium]
MAKKEIEAWGVTYERYALGKELIKLKNDLSIQTVAEIPAHGTKAMPSIYSLGFALAGAEVTLINGFEKYRSQWKRLGLDDQVEFVAVDKIEETNLSSDSFDFVWNFAYMPIADDQNKLFKEMKRISKKYIALFSVNYGNIGFHIHRTLHKLKKVPWTHGDTYYNKRKNIISFMRSDGLRILRRGYVDCPIWPDSLGFRDMRLHKGNITFDNADWESPYIDHLASGFFPFWIRLVYAWEKVPNFSTIKNFYAHINYVIGKKN